MITLAWMRLQDAAAKTPPVEPVAVPVQPVVVQKGPSMFEISYYSFDRIWPMLQDVLAVFAIAILAWIISNWISRLVRNALRRANFDLTLGTFAANLLRWAILVFAFIACLNRFGVETTMFSALIAAGGLAIGLSLQGALSNFASGLMLLIFRPFKVGDNIVVAGQAGIVAEIDLVSTIIDTPDGRRIIVPNGQVFGNVIENTSFHPNRRVEVLCTLAHEMLTDDIHRRLEAIVKSTPGILPSPPPDVAPVDLLPAGETWAIRVFATQAEQGAVRLRLISAIKREVDAGHLIFPVPHTIVTLRQPPTKS